MSVYKALSESSAKRHKGAFDMLEQNSVSTDCSNLILTKMTSFNFS